MKWYEKKNLKLVESADGPKFVETKALKRPVFEKPKKVKKKKRPKVRSRRKVINEFYHSEQWAFLRYDALEKSRGRCECCGASGQEDGIRLMVDHIKPISKFPELKADPNNLQVLCAQCNWGKSARFQTRWRNPDGSVPEA